MPALERAKLIPVSGNNDSPDMDNAIEVQFNPVTLKVSLSNTLKENKNNSNTRAAQYVDKSSSTLAVELAFDTTYIEPASSESASGAESETSGSGEQIEQGSDVRIQTAKIADKFIKPVESGRKMLAPSRLLFQWGSFEFIGMIKSYDETLDFFSPKGRPLRATVSLKLSEDRYQFRSNDSAEQDAEQTPKLAFTGATDDSESGGGAEDGNGSPRPNPDVDPVPGDSADGPGSWRDNAMFNGVESPRLPTASTLALPSVEFGAKAGFGISGGVGLGVDASFGLNASAKVSAGASLSAALNASASGSSSAVSSGTGSLSNNSLSLRSSALSASTTSAVNSAPAVPPASRYGNSSALGTLVPGAFSPKVSNSLRASALQNGGQQLRAESATNTQKNNRRPGAGISLTHLLKTPVDDGVGFD